MRVTPVTPQRLADRIVGLVRAKSGRVRLLIDGAPPTRPGDLAFAVAERLRTDGRPVIIVSADDFLRPASLRLERGRTDPEVFLNDWLDVGGLRREVLEPATSHGSGRVLPRLWNVQLDRSFKASYVTLPTNGVVVLFGSLLLGRDLPADLAVHLHMSPAQLARRIDPEQRWTLPAYNRYDIDHEPMRRADLVVLADHPERPAVQEPQEAE